jgi:hypothetical protein
MNTLSPFKRGDTFILVCTYKTDGTPTPIAGKVIASQIRRANNELIANMVVEPDDINPARFALSPDSDTSEWPLETLFCDVEITEDGFVRSSETINIPVIRDITQ